MSKPITVIDAKTRRNTGFAEIWANRDLIFLLVKRSFTVQYKQTVLGALWAFINPLITTVVYNVVFGRIANLSPDGVESFMFFMSGNLVWSFFSSCFGANSRIFTSNAGLFGKVYFPRIVIPISNCIVSVINFLIQFVFFAGFWIFFYVHNGSGLSLSPYAFMLPLLLLQMIFLGMGLGAVISAITVKYRDLSMLVGFITTLWMYLSPVAYDYERLVSPGMTGLYMLNPMTPVINTFRCGFLGTGVFDFDVKYYLIGFCVSAAVFALGMTVFNRAQRNFIDNV